MVTDTAMSGYIAQWFENTLFRSSAIWSETGLDVRVSEKTFATRCAARRGAFREGVSVFCPPHRLRLNARHLGGAVSLSFDVL